MGLHLFIARENIVVGTQPADKTSAIAQLVGHANQFAPLDTVVVTKLLLDREQKRSSGCGKQIAIPHVINSAVPNLQVVMAAYKTPVTWDSVDGMGVKLVCLVMSPPRRLKEYFDLVNSVAKTLSNDSVRTSLLNMDTPAQIMTVLNAAKDHDG